MGWPQLRWYVCEFEGKSVITTTNEPPLSSGQKLTMMGKLSSRSILIMDRRNMKELIRMGKKQSRSILIMDERDLKKLTRMIN